MPDTENKSSVFSNTVLASKTQHSTIEEKGSTVGNQTSSVFGNGYTFGVVSTSSG